MRASEEIIYRQALESAGQVTLLGAPEKLEELAFPFWQKAVHEVLISVGCQCAYHGNCFLDLNPEKQIILHSGGEFSFEGFLHILTETRNLFLAEATMVSARA
ncbi:MAG: hypothetical protein Q8Q95_01125 [bacterium]|nr:hypothetical protein [bacterium]